MPFFLRHLRAKSGAEKRPFSAVFAPCRPYFFERHYQQIVLSWIINSRALLLHYNGYFTGAINSRVFSLPRFPNISRLSVLRRHHYAWVQAQAVLLRR